MQELIDMVKSVGSIVNGIWQFLSNMITMINGILPANSAYALVAIGAIIGALTIKRSVTD